ncbi:MAG: methyltransferase domain-containing protein [Ectothiorhodospiraceae bacterium]|nr:methyltransferase domain-containing protein [Ectothiorhodospiraceae bacterium]
MQLDEQRLNNFVQQVFCDLAVSTSSVMVLLGHKLDLYQAMAGAGPLTPVELAARSDCAERYVREWLNSQAAANYVDYHAESGRYELAAEQAMVLANPESPVFMPPAWEVAATMWLDEDMAMEAFRTGKGVPWGAHSQRLFCGTAAFFRNGYRENLVPNWLPALEGVVEKLKRGARVADVGCGFGHSATIIAEAFPDAEVHGFDNHPPSIDAARRNAAQAGLADRVQFDVATAKDYPGAPFDLICFFDCLHDMGDPVGAARHARKSLAEGGTVLLVEPYAGNRVEDNLNPVGRMFYAASTTLCCAHSLSEDVGLALGAQAGEERLAQVFREAGFPSFRRATETPFNLILEAC